LVKVGISLIISNSPRKLFAYSLLKLFPDGFVTKNKSNISNTININKGVVLGQGVNIGKNVKIGSNTVIGNGVFIDDGTEIGSNCSIEYSEIGKNCIIYPGVRMGTTGFGFNFDDNGVYKFPHRGKVVIGDNVEIGANSTIDRGSLGDTILGNFVMVDNLVHIAHNVEIGNGCVICGQSGLAGSSKLGNNVILGAQVGVAGHVSIASGTVLSARTGVTKNINSPCLMGGFPAVPINEFRKQVATLRRISKK
jgi:UDP-3-O-[3-hydroxymyristoyl] glucosamine N-acyltransferase